MTEDIEIDDIVTIEGKVLDISENYVLVQHNNVRYNSRFKEWIAREKIKEVKKQSFDWDTVKAGMAFWFRDDVLVYYINKYNNGLLFSMPNHDVPQLLNKSDLTRAKDKDLCDE